MDHLKELIDELLTRMSDCDLSTICTAVVYLLTNLPCSKLEILGIVELSKMLLLKENSSGSNYVR